MRVILFVVASEKHERAPHSRFVCCQVEDINMPREESTGKSRGFVFLKYEDARSCVLAVDNLTGSKVCSFLHVCLCMFLSSVFSRLL